MSDFDKAFEDLMEKIANEAIDAENLADKVDAAKVLQPYYALRKKHRPVDETTGTMDALRKQIRESDNERFAN